MDSDAFTVLSLCSGVGGLDLGVSLAQPNARTICYVEIEAFACEILASRMEEEALDEAPIWTNIKTFNSEPWRGIVDCIIAGYPCQPFSVAGKQRGKDDPRHLWPYIKEIISDIEPSFCFFENVAGHLRLGFEQVHDDLQSMGYCVKAGLFTAEEIGASHRRERLFIMAYRKSDGSDRRMSHLREVQRESFEKYAAEFAGSGSASMADSEGIICERALRERNQPEQSERKVGGRSSKLANSDGSGFQEKRPELQTAGVTREEFKLADPESTGAGLNQPRLRQRAGGNCEKLADGNSARFQERCGCEPTQAQHQASEYCNSLLLFPPGPGGDWQEIPESLKPSICRMADGLADRVDRIRACGNGVVPLAAAYAWHTLFNTIER